MSNITVSFIGEDFVIPSGLREFIKCASYSGELEEELMPLLFNQMKTGQYSGYIDEDFAYFKLPLAKIGNRFIAKLAEDNIFDVTLSELVYENSGYIMLNNVCKETITGVADILCRAMSAYREGYIEAYNEATSSVTGSGLSVWTSDPIDAALFSLMEYSEVKSQINKAEQQYNARLTALEELTQNQQDRETKELLANIYYPGVKEALETFARDIVARYIVKLEQHGLLDETVVDRYDINRSNELLENISFLGNKASVLKEAFLAAPFNYRVYLEAFRYDLADVNTFETAKYLGQGKYIVPKLEQFIKDNSQYVNIIKPAVAGLSIFKGKPEQLIWENIYTEDIRLFHKHYTFLNSIIDDQDKLVKWIRNVIVDDAVELCLMDRNAISFKIQTVLNQDFISEGKYSLFKKTGLLNNEAELVKSSSSLKEVNSKYISKLLKAIDNLIAEQQKIIDRYSVEVERAKTRYEIAKQTYDIQVWEFRDKIQQLEHEKTRLGLFSFSRRKELKQQILQLQSEMLAFTEANKPNIAILENEFKLLYNKIHSF